MPDEKLEVEYVYNGPRYPPPRLRLPPWCTVHHVPSNGSLLRLADGTTYRVMDVATHFDSLMVPRRVVIMFTDSEK